MPKVKQINHVAVVVNDMEKALSFWRDALGMDLHELRDVPAEKSQVAFLPLPGSEVELVVPTTGDSGIAKYLSKHGPGMHHICLEVDDIVGMLEQLRSKKYVSSMKNRAPPPREKYAFIHPEVQRGAGEFTNLINPDNLTLPTINEPRNLKNTSSRVNTPFCLNGYADNIESIFANKAP